MTERKQLPNKDQIDSISDIVALEELRESVDWHKNQIETQLEFGDGDDDWFSRAMSALTAHKICLGHLDRRIRQMTKGLTKPVQVEHVANVHAKKAEKHTAHAERLKAEAMAKQNKAAQTNAESKAKIAKAVEDAHFLGCVLKALQGEVDPERFSRIMDRATEMLAQKVGRAVAA